MTEEVVQNHLRYTQPKRFWLGIALCVAGALSMLVSLIFVMHDLHVNKIILFECLTAIIGVTILTETTFGLACDAVSIAMIIWAILQTKW